MRHQEKLATLTTACLSPAISQAQSSVTIFGLLDVDFPQERASAPGIAQMGNGLKNVCMLEAGVAIDTGNFSGFTRQSFVGLESSFGRVTRGRQYTPAFIAIAPPRGGRRN